MRFRLSGIGSPGWTFGFDSRIYSGETRMLRAAAHRIFLNRRIWDTLAALRFGPRCRSNDAVMQANKVSWSWHKCRRPTATSVAPYAVVVTVSGFSFATKITQRFSVLIHPTYVREPDTKHEDCHIA